MNQPPAVPSISFGRALGEAARSTDALHQQTLAQAQSDFPTWVTFVLLEENSGRAERGWLIDDLGRRLSTTAEDVSTHLNDMAARSFLKIETSEAGPVVVVTAEGAAHFQATRALVNGLTRQLTGDVTSGDIATVVRVLRTVSRRAEALLAQS